MAILDASTINSVKGSPGRKIKPPARMTVEEDAGRYPRSGGPINAAAHSGKVIFQLLCLGGIMREARFGSIPRRNTG